MTRESPRVPRPGTTPALPAAPAAHGSGPGPDPAPPPAGRPETQKAGGEDGPGSGGTGVVARNTGVELSTERAGYGNGRAAEADLLVSRADNGAGGRIAEPERPNDRNGGGGSTRLAELEPSGDRTLGATATRTTEAERPIDHRATGNGSGTRLAELEPGGDRTLGATATRTTEAERAVDRRASGNGLCVAEFEPGAERTGNATGGRIAEAERPTDRGGNGAGTRTAERDHPVEPERQDRPARPVRQRKGRAGERPRHRAFRERAGGGLVAADVGAVVAGAGAAGVAGGGNGAGAAGGAGIAVVVLLVACRQAGLYRAGFDPAALREVPALGLRAALAWGVGAAVVAAGHPGNALGPGALLAAVTVTVLAACVLRALTYGLRRSAGRRHPGSTLVVGADPAVQQIAAALHAHPEYGMRPVGIVAPGPGAEAGDPAVRQLAAALQAHPDPAAPPLPVLAGHGDITRAVIQNSVRHAVVTGPPTLDPRTTATVRLLAAQGICVWQLSTGRGPVPPAHLWGFACKRLELDPYPVPRPGRWAKRALDAAVSGTALLCFSPVLGACALAVRLSDGSGVIFRQERVGLGGRPFTLLKFRTLRPNSAHESATRWSVANDDRTSRVGRFLRRSSLDELPQLWNVLRGDMSLVGPRPERPYFVQQFSTAHPGYQDRHRMPVGITGLAQVHGLRGDTSIADRARFDNHYIDSWSFWQDMAILLRTVGSLFRLGGS